MSDTCCLDSSFTLHRWSESQVHAAVANNFLCGDIRFYIAMLILGSFFVCFCWLFFLCMWDNEAFAITTSDIKCWPVIFFFFAKLDDD